LEKRIDSADDFLSGDIDRMLSPVIEKLIRYRPSNVKDFVAQVSN
jgi:hypothetical protein